MLSRDNAIQITALIPLYINERCIQKEKDHVYKQLDFTVVTDPRNYAQTFFSPETTNEAHVDNMGIQSDHFSKPLQIQNFYKL